MDFENAAKNDGFTFSRRKLLVIEMVDAKIQATWVCASDGHQTIKSDKKQIVWCFLKNDWVQKGPSSKRTKKGKANTKRKME